MIIIEQKEIKIKLKNGTNPIVEINNIIEENDKQQSSKNSNIDVNNQIYNLNQGKIKINSQVEERILQYNHKENCYVSSDEIYTDQDFEQIPANQPVNCNYMRINYHDIIELVKEYLPQILEIYKSKIKDNKEVSGKSLIASFKAIIKELTSYCEIEKDEDYCKSTVWNKICETKSEFFSKKQLTIILQKQYNADQIDIAIKKLMSEGLISFFRIEDNGKTSGRKKSPEYRVNNFRNKSN